MRFETAQGVLNDYPAPSDGSPFVPLVSALYLMSLKSWGQTKALGKSQVFYKNQGQINQGADTYPLQALFWTLLAGFGPHRDYHVTVGDTGVIWGATQG